jgi:hypothetical protein
MEKREKERKGTKQLKQAKQVSLQAVSYVLMRSSSCPVPYLN